MPGACFHRALEPLASTRQLTLNGNQRAAGKHYGRREQFQNIRRRQANLRTLFNRASACDTLILSMLKRFRILIHLRIVALLWRKGMRDHLTLGNHPRGIPVAAGKSIAGDGRAQRLDGGDDFLAAGIPDPTAMHPHSDMQQRGCRRSRRSIDSWLVCAARRASPKTGWSLPGAVKLLGQISRRILHS